MKGQITKEDNEWVIKYPKYPTSKKLFDWINLPIYEANISYERGKIVDFEIVNDQSTLYAKIIE